MRVLFLTPEQPSSGLVNGGATRQFHLIRRLVELGHEVTVVAPFVAPMDAAVRELEAAGARVRAVERPASKLSEMIGAVLRRPSLLLAPLRHSATGFVCDLFWTEIEPIVADELAGGDYDVVNVELAAAWIDRFETAVPVVLTMHEVESPQFFAKAERVGGIAGMLRRRNARRAQAEERRYIPQFDGVVTMSSEEGELLLEVTPDAPPIHPVGNGAQPELFDLSLPTPDSHRVLFTGTMAYTPNRVGAEWLAHEVWPRVREACPQATLEIVGRGAPDQILALGHLPGISVVSDAPEIAPHFAACDVCAIPMLEGGGTRLKVADAMAAGRGIVCTTNGATGIDVENGVELLIADDAEDFAAALLTLLLDPPRRDALGRAARADALETLNWDVLGETLAEAFAAVVASPRCGTNRNAFQKPASAETT